MGRRDSIGASALSGDGMPRRRISSLLSTSTWATAVETIAQAGQLPNKLVIFGYLYAAIYKHLTEGPISLRLFPNAVSPGRGCPRSWCPVRGRPGPSRPPCNDGSATRLSQLLGHLPVRLVSRPQGKRKGRTFWGSSLSHAVCPGNKVRGWGAGWSMGGWQPLVRPSLAGGSL